MVDSCSNMERVQLSRVPARARDPATPPRFMCGKMCTCMNRQESSPVLGVTGGRRPLENLRIHAPMHLQSCTNLLAEAVGTSRKGNLGNRSTFHDITT